MTRDWGGRALNLGTSVDAAHILLDARSRAIGMARPSQEQLEALDERELRRLLDNAGTSVRWN